MSELNNDYSESFLTYKRVQKNGSANRVENGNENVGALQPAENTNINKPRYIYPSSLLDNVNNRYTLGS